MGAGCVSWDQIMVLRRQDPRPLLRPGEIMQPPVAEILMLAGDAPPIRARKTPCFDCPPFTSRPRPAVSLPLALGHNVARARDGVAPAAGLPTPPARAARPTGAPPRHLLASSRQASFDFGAPACADRSGPTPARSAAAREAGQ